ncbi:hypothetical protein IE53DRAFT_207113 [Violaceomyces palustris]|uniref:Uncharacterized protein n=1 Tax=Violaceomyces palustris TaxID=1673888 RepID=A0ACD0NR38_9BASI|nr:hypothetical protein IE53DRAFT_207113 [Violaceomyces palustris]
MGWRREMSGRRNFGGSGVGRSKGSIVETQSYLGFGFEVSLLCISTLRGENDKVADPRGFCFFFFPSLFFSLPFSPFTVCGGSLRGKMDSWVNESRLATRRHLQDRLGHPWFLATFLLLRRIVCRQSSAGR